MPFPGAWLQAISQRLGAWSSWRHPVWPLALLTLATVLVVVRAPPTPPPPPPNIQAEPPPNPPASGPTMDPGFLPILAAARREAVTLGHKRLTTLTRTLSRRVETAFLPRYLSFGRRKFEEIRAYNTFAWERAKGLFGRTPGQDSSIPFLLTTFENDFTALVLTPAETRQSLRRLGREVAQYYAYLVMIGLEKLQTARGIPFAQWQAYLDGLPSGTLHLEGQAPIKVSPAALAVPDPLRVHLGEAIGQALEARFTAFPSITANREALHTPDGRSIFDIGRNAWAYYGSYVVYWILLVILIRSGFIPINLSGALLGWLLWETFVWGTWIAYESLDFEQTKAQLEPIILRHADAYFAALRTSLTDPGPQGPFQTLIGLEQVWP